MEEEPELESDRRQYCANNPPKYFCSPAVLPVGLGVARTGTTPHKACFVFGTGVYDGSEGLLSMCADGIINVLPIPADLRDKLVTPTLSSEKTETLNLAASRDGESHTLAGVPDSGRAFFYRPGDPTAVDLAVDAATHPSFGAGVAVLADGSGNVVLAVSAPDSGEIWLFRDSAAGLEALGCQTVEAGSGALLAAGSLDGDDADDLIFRSGSAIKAVAGAPLFALPTDSSGTCGSAIFGATTELLSATCHESEQVKGCSSSDFGAALAAFDTDGDGREELAVGAPGFTVNGKKDAGALLIFSSTGKFTEAIYRGDSPEKARFGAALSPVAQKDRDVLVVGEPGNNSMSIAYCAGLTSDVGSARCAARVSE
jgi:hypothetical protein